MITDAFTALAIAMTTLKSTGAGFPVSVKRTFKHNFSVQIQLADMKRVLSDNAS
jgi:hypothetical protein